MASDEGLTLLRSIDASLKQLVGLMKVSKPKEIAPDSDLDSQYGDPVIKAADPRDWTGPSQKGKRFSECSSEYLEMVASRLDFFAEKEEREGKTSSTGKLVAPYTRRDAARARGWAKRMREGFAPRAGNGHEQASVPTQWANDAEASMAAASPWNTGPQPGDDDIPF